MNFDYTQRSVQGILSCFNKLKVLRERGNVDAIITVIDIEEALKKTSLSMRQQQVLKLHYQMEFSVKETAAQLGISGPTVVEYKKEIAKKVCNALNGGDKS